MSNKLKYLDKKGLAKVFTLFKDGLKYKPTCKDTNGDLVPDQKFVELTKAEYDALAIKDPDTYYMITDDIAGGDGAFVPVGLIAPFAGSTAPTGWLLCNGQAVSRTDYAKLFNVIGTTYGGGNGSTTFNIPDMRESVPKGIGVNPKGASHVKTGGLALGEFLDDRVQSHVHSAKASATPGQNGTGVAILLGNTDTATGANTGRSGATTEVKSVGTNYIIKY